MNKITLLCFAGIAPSLALAGGRHFVYTLVNQASGNAVRTYIRTAHGRLRILGDTPTGGLGTGHGLGTQGALALTEDGRFILAVNAGDGTVSALRREGDGLVLTDVEPSGGVLPGSVTERNGLVYVLNQGASAGAGDVQGFRLVRGRLVRISDATGALSSPGVIPVEVKFTPNGRGLVVAEKTSNLIDTFRLDHAGLPIDAAYQPSVGLTPFGFDFDRKGRLVITEAFGGAPNASAVSSYSLTRNLALRPISASIPTFQTAACWDVVSPNGRFVYAGNAGSGNVTGYRIAEDGSITLLNPSGVSGVTGGATIDTAMSRGGRYLYVLSNGNQQISVFRVGADGNLLNVGAIGGLPIGTSGLVAR